MQKTLVSTVNSRALEMRGKAWFRALRLVAAPASLGPVAVGGLLPRATGGSFDWLLWGLALLAVLLLHTAANLWNDYYDFLSGLDHVGGATGSGVLPEGLLAPRQVLGAAWACALLAGGIGCWLAWRSAGWAPLLLGMLGLFAARAYSAGPRSPKRHALGELWVFLWMGPAMTGGAELVQTGGFSLLAVWVGLPFGFLTALLMFLANARDLQDDQAVGLHTFAYWVWTHGGTWDNPIAWTAFFLLGAVYLLLGVPSGLPPLARLPFLTLPLAAYLLRQVYRRRYAASIPLLALLQLLFALLFALGLL